MTTAPTALHDALLELAERAGWWGANEAEQAELREIFETRYRLEQERHAAIATWRKGDPPLPAGPPADRHMDGSERRLDGQAGYQCYTCRDTGWVRREGLRVGQEGFGRAVQCACRQPGGASYGAGYKQRHAASFMPPALDRCTLDGFVPVKGAAAALTAAQNWRRDWERGEAGWLVLWGNTGRGKSHLLAGLAHLVLLQGPMIYADVPFVLEQMAANNFAAAEDWMRLLLGTPVLVLDEFGSQSTQPWALQKLELLVTERYAARRPTLFGMTCTAAELEAWSARIHSRLSDRALVAEAFITAPDYRRRGQAEDRTNGAAESP